MSMQTRCKLRLKQPQNSRQINNSNLSLLNLIYRLCLSESKLFWVENVMDLDIFIQPVNNLPRQLVKVIPLKFAGDLLSPFLFVFGFPKI